MSNPLVGRNCNNFKSLNELREQLDEVVAKEGVSLGNWFKELARKELRRQGIEPKG
ncbi:hypothetical protein ACIPSR_09180 [Pectobacterium sp. CHL-2024]|uniref:hypothetical protein n=1 Tax=Pectobacterium sp. CHL-2024 TaxID=3377079 RepID=UPI0037FBF089